MGLHNTRGIEIWSTLSKRAVNCCHRIDVSNMQELLQYSKTNDMNNIPNCGNKTAEELKNALIEYDANAFSGLFDFSNDERAQNIATILEKEYEHLQPLYNQILDDADDSIRIYYRNRFEDVGAFISSALSNGKEHISDDGETDVRTLQQLWLTSLELLRSICTALQDEPEDNLQKSILLKRIVSTKNYIEIFLPELTISILLKRITPTIQRILKAKYQTILNTLSARSRNVLNAAEIDELGVLHLVNKSETEIYGGYANCGRKSALEIKQKVSEYYDHTLQLLEIGTTQHNLLLTKIQFPFLTDKQAERINSFYTERGRYPLYYLCSCFYMATTDRSDRIANEYFGITQASANMSDVASRYNITGERVRQIIMAYDIHGAIPGIKQIDSLAEDYPFITHPVVNAQEIYDELGEVEYETDDYCTIESLCSITRLLFNDYLGYIRHEQSSVFVRKDVYDNYNLEKALSGLAYLASLRNTAEVVIEPQDYLRKYAEADTECTDAGSVFARLAQSVLGTNIDSEGNIVIDANAIDLEKEIYIIIEQNAKPMAFADIVAELQKRHPTHSYVTGTIRAYILASERITHIGHTSSYALKEWGLNHETLRSLQRKIVSESDVPLSMAQITERIKELGRDTNAVNVYASIYLDEGYVWFEGNLVGCQGREYGPSYRPLDPHEKIHKDFDCHLKEYTDFIDTYHHIPYSSPEDEEEASLYRWYSNFTKGRIDCTPEQQERLAAAMAEREQYIMPGHEYRFLQNCQKYREYIESNHLMPNSMHGKQLHNWYISSKRGYSKLTERKQQALAELEDYLQQNGYIF